MASYLNRKNESIEVTDDHIKTAIAVKTELQKESPSGKCSWVRHKKMMEREGYYDSDKNENYRQLIKREQRKQGQLPTLETYVDMTADKKLESIKEAIGEMYISKRASQNANRELNKVKREITDNMLFLEDIKEHISNADFSSLNASNLKSLPESKNTMLVNASDWHIGLETDEFNYEIAKKRVLQYAEEILHYAKMFGINKVYVQNIGDVVEGAYLRSTQAFDIEFDYSEQIVKATEIMFWFMNTLSQEVEVVYIGGLAGNHSRMFSKGLTLNNNMDSAENIIDTTIKSFVSMANNPRISVEDKKQDNSAISTEINGRFIKSIHGDLVGKNGDRISKFISSDNINYDLLIYGHFHHASLMERNHDKLEIGVGCLYGNNGFSKQLGYDTKPSQTIVVFEGSKMLPIRITLD